MFQRGVISNSRPLAAAEGRSHVLSVTATDCGGELKPDDDHDNHGYDDHDQDDDDDEDGHGQHVPATD